MLKFRKPNTPDDLCAEILTYFFRVKTDPGINLPMHIRALRRRRKPTDNEEYVCDATVLNENDIATFVIAAEQAKVVHELKRVFGTEEPFKMALKHTRRNVYVLMTRLGHEYSVEARL